MPINKLTSVDSLQGGDNIPIYDASNGDDRRVSTTALQSYMQSNLTFPADPRPFTRTNSAPSASGFTVTSPDNSNNQWLVITPAAGYAAGTIKLPAVGNAVDGQEILVNITQSVTALTVDGNGATAVTGEPAAIKANDSFRLKFDSSTSTWYNVAVDQSGSTGVVSNFSTAGPTDNVDVGGVDVLAVDTSSGSVTIGGLINGINGQQLQIVRQDSSNSLIIEHSEGTGNQDIFLSQEADLTLNKQGGVTLICNGTNWRQTGEVQSAITQSAAGPTDNLSVAGVNIVLIDTSSNDVTVGGLVGGFTGQVVQFVKIDSGNDLILEHAEGTGNQDIYLACAADKTIKGLGGVTLVFGGTNWRQVSDVPATREFSDVGPSDNVDVAGIDTLFINTSSNSVTIGGLIGGILGQHLDIVRKDSSNTLVIEHNEGSANQDIQLAGEADLTLYTYGGVRLRFDGTNWVEVGKRPLGTSTLSLVGPTDNVEAAGIKTILVDTSSNNVTIGAFVNGVRGQEIEIVKTSSLNVLTIEFNEGTGNQNILLAGSADLNIAGYGGVRLKCDGTFWYQASPALSEKVTVSAAGPTDNVDVTGCKTVIINNSSNAVTIGGFVGGVEGQYIDVIVTSSANNATLEFNEGTGNQDIILNGSADSTITTDYGGWRLYYDGSFWYEVKN
jgi:hypothetical protein